MSRIAERESGVAAHRLRILVADETERTLRVVERRLSELGHEVTARTVSVAHTAECLLDDDPDLSIVVVDGDHDHALSLVQEMSEYARGPIVLLLDDENASEVVARAAEHGIHAFARARFAAELRGAIELAVRHHAEQRRLSEEVGRLESALERRGAIEQAKGILMERHGLDAQSAFELLRGQARGSNQRVADLARAVSDGRALLPRDVSPDQPGSIGQA